MYDSLLYIDKTLTTPYIRKTCEPKHKPFLSLEYSPLKLGFGNRKLSLLSLQTKLSKDYVKVMWPQLSVWVNAYSKEFLI